MKPSAVFAPRHPPVLYFHAHKQGGALSGVCSYFLVIWLGAIFSSTQITAIFSDQDISKCLYNLVLVIERTNRIILVVYNVTHVINHAVLVAMFK